MKDIDYSELKAPVGRPEEGEEQRIDLRPYLVDKKFERRFTPFFEFWDKVVNNKTVNEFRPKAEGGETIVVNKYRENMETFYGEALEKFSELSSGRKVEVLNSKHPIDLLFNLTNLTEPNVFPNEQDNKDFISYLRSEEL